MKVVLCSHCQSILVHIIIMKKDKRDKKEKMKKMIRETKKIPSEMYDVRSTALYAALLTLLTWFTPLTWFTLLTWLTLLTRFTLLTWFALLTWLALLTGDGWIGRMGHTPETVTTVTNIAVVAHYALGSLHHYSQC